MPIPRGLHARRRVAVLLLAATLPIACTGAPSMTDTPRPVPPATTAPVSTPVPGAPTPVPIATTEPDPSFAPDPDTDGIVPPAVLEAVVADAVARTGAATADVTVVWAAAVTWPNGALGCPQPGFMYTERIEPGYHVVVDVAGIRLDYRFGLGGAPRLCENPPPEG